MRNQSARQRNRFNIRLAAAIFFAMTTCLPSISNAASLDEYTAIVVAEKAPEPVSQAAQDLQYHLEKIAGRQLPLVQGKANVPPQGLHFYVGSSFWPELDARAAKLGPEGWMITSVPNGLLLTGSGEDTEKFAGVEHAVSLFLEKHCGVRWLWPGQSGEIIPANAKLTIPQLDENGVPPLRRRQMTFGYIRYWDQNLRPDLNKWTVRTRQGDQFQANFGHAWATVIPPALYFKEHPEWFGLVDGKRVPLQLCISNPQLRDEFVKRLLSLPANQKLDIVSVSANDGFGFCECDLCKAKGTIGDSYWDFVNDIAQRVKKAKPGLGVGTFAYTFGRQPPAKIAKLPDNVYLSMTTYSTQLMRPEGQAEYESFINAWKSKGVKIVMREYWGMHYWLDLPVLYPDEIATTIKMGRKAGMMGAYGETGKNWATQAPNYYVLTHLLWDPDADPQAVLDDFYATFGPAAKPVRAYFQTLQDAIHRAWNDYKLEGSYIALVTRYGDIFTPALLTKAAAHLDEAAKAAGNDNALKSRIEFLRAGCDYTKLMGELLSLYDKLGRTGFPLESFEWEATVEGRRRLQKTSNISEGRDVFETRLKEAFPYTLAEKDAWLQRAWDLGQQRIRMLNAHRGDFALDEGLYAITLEYNMRQWHQTVGKYLGKAPEEIVTLDYTHPVKKAE